MKAGKSTSHLKEKLLKLQEEKKSQKGLFDLAALKLKNSEVDLEHAREEAKQNLQKCTALEDHLD